MARGGVTRTRSAVARHRRCVEAASRKSRPGARHSSAQRWRRSMPNCASAAAGSWCDAARPRASFRSSCERSMPRRGVERLVRSAGNASRDRRLQSALEEAGCIAAIAHDAPAIPPDETAAMHTADGRGYRALAPYFQAWRGQPVASYEYPLLLHFADCNVAGEPLPQAHEFGAQNADVAAGPAAAQRCFDEFLHEDAPQYALLANVAGRRTGPRTLRRILLSARSPRARSRGPFASGSRMRLR